MPDTTLAAHYPYKSPAARERYRAFRQKTDAAWPVESEVRMVPTSFGETFVRISGATDAPALVLMPGGRTTSMCWATLAGPLSEHYRLYALDAMYDNGLSTPTREMKTHDDVTAWLDETLDGLGLTDPVNMMGLSFGGFCTSLYALHAPKRVHKAVLLAPAATVLPISNAFIARSMVCLIPAKAAYRSFARWILPRAARNHPKEFEEFIDEMDMGMSCFKFRMWPGGGPVQLSDEQLSSIEVPLLFIMGDEDLTCPDVPGAVQRLQTLAPGVERHIVAGAGHDVPFEQPDVIVHLALDFLGA